MKSLSQDLRCNKILSGIKSLLTELGIDLVANLLEIKSNPDSKANFSQLNRIERTTDQYIRRTNNLFYIGFLGHFSSGKSSTINTILKIKGTKYEKNATQNPTDDQITLMTSINNNEDVLKLIRSGDVPVIISLVEGCEFLKNKVIMDTPGSGDPATFEEIVRDSLPLCDLIVYCLSATQPLTNSDIPLLTEKEKNLQNIPTIYLITRGNEFKINALQRLNDLNFDQAKYGMFASQLASRIKSVVDSIDLSYNDFIVIDNHENFKIEQLLEKINFYCNPENYGNILHLHDHKIDYFIKALKDVKSFFLNLITEKLLTVDEYFSQAKINIAEYDKKTLIGTDKMINGWRNVDEKIKQAIDGSINQNNIVSGTLNIPTHFDELPATKLWYSKYNDQFQTNNEQEMFRFTVSVNTKLVDIKEKVRERLYASVDNGYSFELEDIRNFLQGELKDKIIFKAFTSYESIKLYKDNHKVTFDYLNDEQLSNFKRQLDSAKNRIRSSNPIDTIDKQIQDAKRILYEIFQTYIDGVKIYTVAAFSLEAKKYIRKLGLSDELDKIDTETPNILDNLKIAEEKVFASYNTASKKFQEECFEINSILHSIELNHPSFSTYNNEDEIINEEHKLEEIAKKRILYKVDNFSNRISDYFISKVQSIQAALLTFIIDRDREFVEIRKKRIKFYLIRFIPTIVLLIITFILFVIFPNIKLSSNLTIGGQWVLGLIVNACTGIINGIVNVKNDKHNLLKDEIISRFTENEKELIARKFSEDYDVFRMNAVHQLKDEILEIQKQQAVDTLNLIISLKFNENNYNVFVDLANSENKLKKCLAFYSNSLNEFKLTVTNILNSVNKNKDILLTESKQIKDNSINPSFILLANTRENIRQVKAKIETIEFS